MGRPRTHLRDPFLQMLFDRAGVPDETAAAEKTGISRDVLYHHAKKGCPRLDVMVELTDAFQVDRKYLLEYIASHI